MSRALDTIKSVNDSKELWKLGVRLEDIWTVTNQGKEHLEFIILDKQGDQIQVLLPSDVTALWKSTLVEGETYVMKNFKVHDNNFAVKYCLHPFKLQFVGGEGGSDVIPTKMTNILEMKIVKYSLKFSAGNIALTNQIQILTSRLNFSRYDRRLIII
jgi:hypothetical protein